MQHSLNYKFHSLICCNLTNLALTFFLVCDVAVFSSMRMSLTDAAVIVADVVKSASQQAISMSSAVSKASELPAQSSLSASSLSLPAAVPAGSS